MNYYDLIMNNLKSVGLHTMLLEACDWDEDLLKEQIEIFSDIIKGFYFPKNFTWEMMKTTVRERMKNRIETNLVEIFISILENEKDNIIKYSNMEEN